MSTKADLKRARMSLERERVRLKADALALDKDRRALAREREAVVLALRELCARVGDNAWTDETPLPRVITEYLGVPVMRREADLCDRLAELLERRRPAPPPPQPAPLRPTPLPEAVHRCMVVRTGYHGASGYGAVCVCGWRSPIQHDEPGALEAGSVHADRSTAARRAASS